jgi:lipopolysaccharide biosynthesis protein
MRDGETPSRLNAFVNRLLSRKKSDDGTGTLALANRARDFHDWVSAAENYRAYLAIQPSDFAIWVQLGHALKEMGRFDEALAAYNQAMRLNGVDADLLLNLGHVHKLAGDRNNAIHFYRRSAAVDSNLDALAELRALGDPSTRGELQAPRATTTSAGQTTMVRDERPRTGGGEKPPFVGSLDEIVGGQAVGWVWNPREPDVPAEVEFIVNGEVIHRARARIVRKDVKWHGWGGGVAGFHTELPMERLRGMAGANHEAEVHACLAGTVWELAGSPKQCDVFASSSKDMIKVPHASTWSLPDPMIKTVAFYLPQFHPFAENSRWWGPGFTEWTNVTRATPLFDGHYQPHRPGELGYYDLRVQEVQERQAELAKLFGIHAFCFYFYWFSGKILMEEPIRRFAENGNIDRHFCLCWANENWTRRWDGLDNETLIAQHYSAEDDIRFIAHISSYFRNARYLKIDGKPIVIVYRAQLLPNGLETSRRWRDYCRKEGFGEIYLVCTLAFGAIEPRDIGFDAALEFPPNMTKVSGIDPDDVGIDEGFSGKVFDYKFSVSQSAEFKPPPFSLIRGVFPSWVNTPRRQTAATLFLNSTPALYGQYLETIADQVLAQTPNADEQLVFINAWNEWAEGAHLEPDERNGYAYLEATRMALIRAEAKFLRASNDVKADLHPRLAVIVHAFYLDVVEELIPLFSRYPAGTEFFFTTPWYQMSGLSGMLSGFPHRFEILTVLNRGRDVAPFLQTLAHIWNRDFKYILKLHTKKSRHRDDGDQWRNDIIDTLASPDQVRLILTEMDRRPEIGILGPENHVLSMTTFWGSNSQRVLDLGARMGMTDIRVTDMVFVAGTMFFARQEALKPLMGLSLTIDDFEVEEGQVDATLAHAIERALTLSAAAVGFVVRGVGRVEEGCLEIFDVGNTAYAHAEVTSPATASNIESLSRDSPIVEARAAALLPLDLGSTRHGQTIESREQALVRDDKDVKVTGQTFRH